MAVRQVEYIEWSMTIFTEYVAKNNTKIWIYARRDTRHLFYNLWEIDSILYLFSLFYFFRKKQENSFNFKLLGRNELLGWLGELYFYI